MSATSTGRKLGRKTGARVSLLRGLATELIRYEKIKTTVPRAKETARITNHLIAVAKRGDLNARRKVARDIHDFEVKKKLFDILTQRYANRVGGCTKIYRLQHRQGDNVEMALVKLIA